MNVLETLILGTSIGVGLTVVYLHIGRPGGEWRSLAKVVSVRSDKRNMLRLYSCGAALIAFIASGWIVLSVACGVCVYALPSFFGMNSHRKSDERKALALSTWAEQLRDSVAVSGGLEQALMSTSSVAPEAIQPELKRLIARLAYSDTNSALRKFGDEIGTSLGDFLVAALVIAISNQARDLTSLLSHLAETAQDEYRASTRIWVGRARTRSSIKIIVGAVVAFTVGLFVLDRPYLEPYGTAEGQVVLGVVIALFGMAFLQLQRLATTAAPHRFLMRREAVTA